MADDRPYDRDPAYDQQLLDWFRQAMATDPAAAVLAAIIHGEAERGAPSVTVSPHARVLNMDPVSGVALVSLVVTQLLEGMEERKARGPWSEFGDAFYGGLRELDAALMRLRALYE